MIIMARKPRESSTIGTAFCNVCENEVSVTLVDDGFCYEYGNDKGTHHDWGAECSECGERIQMKDITKAEDDRDYGDNDKD